MADGEKVTPAWPTGRHPSVAHFEPLFAWDHLPEHLQEVSQPFGWLAKSLVESLWDGLELSACLRKLVEAKDCAVRQAVIDRAQASQNG